MRPVVGGLRVAAGLAAWAAMAGPCRGIINPNFTPRQLVDQSKAVMVATVQAGGGAGQWELTAPKAIKGALPAEKVLGLAGCRKDHAGDIAAALARCAKEGQPVLLFVGGGRDEGRAYLHADGRWSEGSRGQGGAWEIKGYAPHQDGTYTGGTDMLVRMAGHLIGDPEAGLAVRADVRWGERARVGTVAGEVAGLAAIERAGAEICLYVGCADGDRLYRARKDGNGWEDATSALRLAARSRRFVWMDVTGDGVADLVSWDGQAVSLHAAGKDGAYEVGAEGWRFAWDGDCTGLAACSAAGRAAVVAGAGRVPLLLVAGPKGWERRALPAGPAAGSAGGGGSCPCIVADLDNDGYADILQPLEDGGVLWRGGPDAFLSPARTAVATGGGAALSALGDFDGDGALDIFLAGSRRNSLWQNDGKGGFREVIRHSGSVGYKCLAGARDVRVLDLNHDGWQDLCLVYESEAMQYHFNRGFRTFADEGEVRLAGPREGAGGQAGGQRAIVDADLNGDDSLDLAVLQAGGELWCYFNARMDMPGLRLRLDRGEEGPITASCWMGKDRPLCTGTASVAGRSSGAFISVRYPGRVTVRYRLRGRDAQERTVVVKDGTLEVVLGRGAGGDPGARR